MSMHARDWFSLLGATTRSAAVPPTAIPDLLRTLHLQLVFTFFQGVPAVTLVAILGSGFALILRTAYGSLLLGLSPDAPLTQFLLDLAVREAIPIAAAIVVTARSGTAVASELSAAVVDSEVEAMDDLGVSPLQFWVIPRIVGLALSTFALALYLTATSLVLYWVLGPIEADFRTFTVGVISLADFLVIGLKALVAGAGVGFVSAGYGLLATRSVSDLPRSVAGATMGGVMWCLVSSLLITAFFVGL